MIASTFSLNLAFSLVPMPYDEQSISSPGKRLSQLASINCCHPQPLPSPIKNGAIFLLAAWNLNCRTLHVRKLKNMPVVYLGQQLMTCISVSWIQQLPLLIPFLTLRLRWYCGVFRSSTLGLSSSFYTSVQGRWTLMLSNAMRLSVMLCSSPHYRLLMLIPLSKGFAPEIGGLVSPPFFNSPLS